MTVLSVGIALIALGVVVGCNTQAESAVGIYTSRCASCHGDVGQGGGRVARALHDEPTRFNRIQWRRSVGRRYVREVILNGGEASGISPLMPSNRDLADRQKLVDDLIDLVFSFSGKR